MIKKKPKQKFRLKCFNTKLKEAHDPLLVLVLSWELLTYIK